MERERKVGLYHLRPRSKIKKNNNTTSTAGSSTTAPTPPWIDLPIDLTANILQRLGPAEIITSAENVCKTWRRVCRDPSLWRVIDFKKSPNVRDHRKLERFCRLAVDRSRKQLIDIDIESYCTDVLLRFISYRGRHLKRMTLALCEISARVLMKIVKKFPLLEELHLIERPLLSSEDIESISFSCPMLKSFSYNNRCYDIPFLKTDDSRALSIAKSMSGLRRLSLFGNMLSNVGLEAILKGCPNLESLDLRQCFRVDLECELGRRCLEQIKEVRHPKDSTADYEWDAEIYEMDDYHFLEFDAYVIFSSEDDDF